MDSENQEVIYCPEDGEYRIYCNICDKLCIEDIIKTFLNHKLIQIIFIKDNVEINCFH